MAGRIGIILSNDLLVWFFLLNISLLNTIFNIYIIVLNIKVKYKYISVFWALNCMWFTICRARHVTEDPSFYLTWWWVDRVPPSQWADKSRFLSLVSSPLHTGCPRGMAKSFRKTKLTPCIFVNCSETLTNGLDFINPGLLPVYLLVLFVYVCFHVRVGGRRCKYGRNFIKCHQAVPSKTSRRPAVLTGHFNDNIRVDFALSLHPTHTSTHSLPCLSQYKGNIRSCPLPVTYPSNCALPDAHLARGQGSQGRAGGGWWVVGGGWLKCA